MSQHRQHRKLVAMVVGTVALTVGVSGAVAAIPDRNGIVRSDHTLWLNTVARPAGQLVLEPFNDPDHWTTFAVDAVDGADGTDGATGPQRPAGPAGATGPQGPAGLSGVETVTRQVSLSMGETREAIAQCPPGKVALGGGFDASDVRILHSGPTALGDGWKTIGVSEYVVPSNSPLFAYPICAFAS